MKVGADIARRYKAGCALVARCDRVLSLRLRTELAGGYKSGPRWVRNGVGLQWGMSCVYEL